MELQKNILSVLIENELNIKKEAVCPKYKGCYCKYLQKNELCSQILLLGTDEETGTFKYTQRS